MLEGRTHDNPDRPIGSGEDRASRQYHVDERGGGGGGGSPCQPSEQLPDLEERQEQGCQAEASATPP